MDTNYVTAGLHVAIVAPWGVVANVGVTEYGGLAHVPEYPQVGGPKKKL